MNDARQLIQRKWPEALCSTTDDSELVFSTGFPDLDTLFPLFGIPYGQLIEVTGGISSGKTSLLLRLLAQWTKSRMVCYVDFSDSFFPDAAISSGVNLNRLMVIKPETNSTGYLKTGIRTVELLQRGQTVGIIVFDLVGQHNLLPISLLHRLRLKTVRSKGLVVFLTQSNSHIIPSSMASLRLEVRRSGDGLEITVTKSRISTEGSQVEVRL